jgi:hypothetical protein
LARVLQHKDKRDKLFSRIFRQHRGTRRIDNMELNLKARQDAKNLDFNSGIRRFVSFTDSKESDFAKGVQEHSPSGDEFVLYYPRSAINQADTVCFSKSGISVIVQNKFYGPGTEVDFKTAESALISTDPKKHNLGGPSIRIIVLWPFFRGDVQALFSRDEVFHNSNDDMFILLEWDTLAEFLWESGSIFATELLLYKLSGSGEQERQARKWVRGEDHLVPDILRRPNFMVNQAVVVNKGAVKTWTRKQLQEYLVWYDLKAIGDNKELIARILKHHKESK